MEDIDIIGLVGGVPFVDASFQPGKALTAVAVSRAHRCGRSANTLGALAQYLDPVRGYEIARRSRGHAPIDAQPLSQADRRAMDECVRELCAVRPDWVPLVSGPFVYMRINTEGVFSLTNTAVPQFVFLGNEALRSPEDLKETLVHELAHAWLGLLNEVAPLARASDTARWVLPSGTPNKTTAGVLLAAHFAASAISWHDANRPVNHPRLAFLRDYLAGCLRLLEDATGLSASGAAVRDGLAAFSARRFPRP
jgi:HEXXH motif-containing protein